MEPRDPFHSWFIWWANRSEIFPYLPDTIPCGPAANPRGAAAIATMTSRTAPRVTGPFIMWLCWSKLQNFTHISRRSYGWFLYRLDMRWAWLSVDLVVFAGWMYKTRWVVVPGALIWGNLRKPQSLCHARMSSSFSQTCQPLITR